MAEYAHVNLGEWKKADFAVHDAIQTANLRPCVAIISSNGTMAHLDPNTHGKEQLKQYMRWLKDNAPAGTEIALVGSKDTDDVVYQGFKTSADMVDYIKAQLNKAGFPVVFEDLFGDHLRDVSLDRNGTIHVSDQHNPSYQKSYTFTEREERQNKGDRPR